MNWFDPSDDVIIDPRIDGPRHWKRQYGTDEIVITERLIYANNGLGKLLDRTCLALDELAEPVQDLRSGGYARYRLPFGEEITVCRAIEPAPYCAADFDVLLAAGARQVLFLNGSGSLRPDVPVGSVVLPGELVREEGTSSHYVPAGATLHTDEEMRERAARIAASLGIETARGRHWTTDAIYRETVGKVERFRESGVVTVDMELTALAGVAHYYGCRFAAALVVTDVVAKPHTWTDMESPHFGQGADNVAAIAARVFA